MRARGVTVGRGRRGGNRFGGFNKSKIYICSASIEWVSRRVRARVAFVSICRFGWSEVNCMMVCFGGYIAGGLYKVVSVSSS